MKKLLSVMVAAAAVGTAFGNAMPDPEAAKLLKELAKSYASSSIACNFINLSIS